jgi:hypothetical protein
MGAVQKGNFEHEPIRGKPQDSNCFNANENEEDELNQ